MNRLEDRETFEGTEALAEIPFTETLKVDRSSSVPVWLQLKEQIKVAYALGRLQAGDVMPSIRALARRLSVSDATVRRAYRDLTELGFLSAEPRKHLMVTETLSKSRDVSRMARECEDECDRVMQWAKDMRVSTIALARLLQRRATQLEGEAPSYVYVDASTLLADRFAEQIAEAWELPVLGLSLDDVARLSRDELDRFTAILVNAYRHETLTQLLKGRRCDGVYAVKFTVHHRIINRLRRLPRGSLVLLVFQDLDASRIGGPVVDYIQKEVGAKISLEAREIGGIDDLEVLVSSGRYRLLVVSGHLWHLVPERAKRHPSIIAAENELNRESLERIRVEAGVIV